MLLMHLSDLHLGKRLCECSLLDDQRHILREIIDLAAQEHPDAVLIAGDLYDKPVPPAEAVSLCDAFLTQLAGLGCAVCVLSGNHDSAERVAFGGSLLAGQRVYLSPVYSGHVQPVRFEDAYGEVCLWQLPFLKPATVRHAWPEEADAVDSYDAAVRLAVQKLGIDPAARNVIIAHQFVTGAVRRDSEEVSVGGLDDISADIFDAFDYTALGHLHSAQNLAGGRVRYCGTPLKYSFSEANDEKSVTLVELGEKGSVSLRTVPLIPAHDLRQLRGTYLELTDPAFYKGTATDDYLRIILTDEEDVPEAVGRLRSVYPNLLRLDYDNLRTRENRAVDLPAAQNRSPLDYFAELYEKQNNRPMSEEQTAFCRTLIEEIWNGKGENA